jgi:CRP/FNR family transcriptional regulator
MTPCTIDDTIALLREHAGAYVRPLHEGTAVYRRGQPFSNLYVLGVGSVKLLGNAADGRPQVVGLRLRGDWLGLDGVPSGHHASDAVSMDVGQAWVVPYAALLKAGMQSPQVLGLLHAAMSGEIVRERERMVAMGSLTVHARIAAFLHRWSDDLARRGLHSASLRLGLTRAEIGAHLGVTLETVSRALSSLERDGVIGFGQNRRDLHILDPVALAVCAGAAPPVRAAAAPCEPRSASVPQPSADRACA